MSWIIPALLALMIYKLFSRWHSGRGEYIELFGAIAMCIIFITYLIGFAVGAAR